jgi:hypothetical protein
MKYVRLASVMLSLNLVFALLAVSIPGDVIRAIPCFLVGIFFAHSELMIQYKWGGKLTFPAPGACLGLSVLLFVIGLVMAALPFLS